MLPGHAAAPFVDYAAEVAALGPVERRRVMGKASYALVESGAVEWRDVVTRTRIRPFAEVVERAGLTERALVQAGVAPRQARQAHQALPARQARARAEAAAQAEAKAKAPRAMTEADLRRRAGQITAPDLAQQAEQLRAAAREFLASRPVTPPHKAQQHSMADPETFVSVTFDGIRFHYPHLPGATEPPSVIVDTLADLARRPALPAALARHTTDVYLSTQVNKDDAYWQAKYNRPNLVGGATGGLDQTIVRYRGRAIGGDTLAHEAGHNLAHALYGQTRPPLFSGYGRAMATGEPPVSGYAKASPAEDFAESVKHYVLWPDEMRARSPARFEAIRTILEDEHKRKPKPEPKSSALPVLGPPTSASKLVPAPRALAPHPPATTVPAAHSPIAAKLAAWTEGDARVRALQDLDDDTTRRHRAAAQSAQGRYTRALAALETAGPAEQAELRTVARLAQEDLLAARDRMRTVIERQRPAALAQLSQPEAERFGWEHRVKGKAKDLPGLVEQARAAVEPMVKAGAGASVRTSAVAWKSGKAGSRALYDEAGRAIRLQPLEEVHHAVHEWGHAIEYQVPGVRKAAMEFLAHRVGDEAPQKLAELFPNQKYEPDETGRRDHFDDHFEGVRAYYVGKVYADGGTEIVSMGLEALYRDPAGFAQNDPEFCKFILGTLSGDLR